MKKKIIIIITVLFLVVGSALFIKEEILYTKDELAVKAAESACSYTKMCINGKITEEELYEKLGEIRDKIDDRAKQQEPFSKSQSYCERLSAKVSLLRSNCDLVMLGTKNYDDLEEILKELEKLI